MPLNPAPASVTVLPVPTFASAKVAVPPIRLTLAASPASTPESVCVSTVALVLPLYTLLSAVKLPVMCKAEMLAVAVSVVEASV